MPDSLLQFSRIDDTEFRDRSPVNENANVLDTPPASEGAQGWFDVEEASPQFGEEENSENEASDHSASDHSATTLRQSNRFRRPVE